MGDIVRAWIRDRSLGIFFCSVFLVTWIGQLVVEWLQFVNEEADHGEGLDPKAIEETLPAKFRKTR